MKVLFVCLGNICRSPLAEAIFMKKVRDFGLDNFISADSCGTGNYHVGDQPDPRSQEVARVHQVPMLHHAKWLQSFDKTEFDYIIAMDSSNLNGVKLWLGSETKPCLAKMRAFDTVNIGGDVPDPYYGDMRDFEQVFQMLDRCCENLIKHLIEEKGNAVT